MAHVNEHLENETEPLLATQQITSGPTADGSPVSVSTSDPDPHPDPPPALKPGVAREPVGEGVEGEEVVWDGRYSLKNFAGRIVWRVAATLGLVALAVLTWGEGHDELAFLTILAAITLGLFWIALAYRIAHARLGHHYQLTNRRLFVSTGLMRRRRDQMELLRVKDVFTRHTLLEGWLSLGTVVVVSTEHELPVFYLTGVDGPQQIMDLIWHHARAERERHVPAA